MWAYIHVMINLFTHQEGEKEYVLTHFQTDISKPGMLVQGHICSKLGGF